MDAIGWIRCSFRLGIRILESTAGGLAGGGESSGVLPAVGDGAWGVGDVVGVLVGPDGGF